MQTPDWNDIHYFITLVEAHTLSAAAEKLDVGHNTVSRRIARLETVLGLRLFDRIGKRYLPTEHALRLYHQACELDKGVAVFWRMAQEECQAMAEVVLTAPPVVVHGLVTPHLPDFYRQHSGINLVLQSATTLFDLHRREADIALRLAYPEQGDLVVRRLCNLGFGFYAHPDYLGRTPRETWQFILLSADTTLSHAAALAIKDEKVLLRCNDFTLIKQAVTAQLGIGFLPECYVDKQDGFRRVSLGYMPPNDPKAWQKTLFMVMHEDVRRSPAVRAVADFWAQVLAV